MNVLHIAKDEKFIDVAIEEFNRVSWIENRFMVVSDGELKYVKSKVDRISFLEYSHFMFDFKSYSSYKLIVFHSIDIYDRQFLKNIPRTIKILWIGWGVDYLNIVDYSKCSFLSKKTKGLLDRRKRPLKIWIEGKFKQSFLVSLFQTLKFRCEINRVDFFAPVIKEDYLIIKNRWSNFKPKYVMWNYGVFAGKVDDAFNYNTIGNNIIVGNSASPFNNHLDIFDKLSNLYLGDSKIVCPLSYGDKWYARQVITQGKRLFNGFYPLVEFLKLEDYYSALRSCSIGIFGQYRQQASGNIGMLLATGAKIFLYERNPLFQYYTSQGYIIYKIEDLDQTSLTQLSHEEIMHNKHVTLSRFKQSNFLNRTELLVREIFSN